MGSLRAAGTAFCLIGQGSGPLVGEQARGPCFWAGAPRDSRRGVPELNLIIFVNITGYWVPLKAVYL